MKKSKIKIWHIIICLIFIISVYLITLKISIKDNENINKIVENITLCNDSAAKIEFCFEDDFFLKSFGLEGIPSNDSIYYEITDENGYYLETGILSDENRQDENILNVVNAKIEHKNTHIISLQLRESRTGSIDTTLTMELVGYKKISSVCRCMAVALCIIASVIFMLTVSESPIYVNLKSYCKRIFFSDASPHMIEYAIAIIIFILLMVSSVDGDTLAFVHYEVNFWRSVFQEGGLRHFYDYSYLMEQYYKANQIGGAYAFYYDFPMCILFGIWGLPLYLICRIFGIEETSNIGTIIYGKSIFLVSTLAVAYIVYRLCRNMNVDKTNSKWSVFIFLTSVLTLVDVAYIGQLDIMGIIFTLIGIYFYQKKDRLKFVLFFMIAVSFKQFPLFMFVPLLLLVEKNIVKIGFDTLIVLLFPKLTGLIFRSDTMAVQVKNEFSEKSLETLLGVKAPLYTETVPIVIIIMGILCVCCYLKNYDFDEKILKEYSIVIPLLSMVLLLISFDSNPYWYIQLAPFMAILAAYNSKQNTRLLLFETLGLACLVMSQYSGSYWIFDPDQSKEMVLAKIFGEPETYLSMQKFAAYTRLDRFSGVLYGAFIVCIFAFLWLCRQNKMEQSDRAVYRPYALARMLINMGIAYIPVLLYVASLVLMQE